MAIVKIYSFKTEEAAVMLDPKGLCSQLSIVNVTNPGELGQKMRDLMAIKDGRWLVFCDKDGNRVPASGSNPAGTFLAAQDYMRKTP